jgi:hypothetical protein
VAALDDAQIEWDLIYVRSAKYSRRAPEERVADAAAGGGSAASEITLRFSGHRKLTTAYALSARGARRIAESGFGDEIFAIDEFLPALYAAPVPRAPPSPRGGGAAAAAAAAAASAAAGGYPRADVRALASVRRARGDAVADGAGGEGGDEGRPSPPPFIALTFDDNDEACDDGDAPVGERRRQRLCSLAPPSQLGGSDTSRSPCILGDHGAETDMGGDDDLGGGGGGAGVNVSASGAWHGSAAASREHHMNDPGLAQARPARIIFSTHQHARRVRIARACVCQLLCVVVTECVSSLVARHSSLARGVVEIPRHLMTNPFCPTSPAIERTTDGFEQTTCFGQGIADLMLSDMSAAAASSAADAEDSGVECPPWCVDIGCGDGRYVKALRRRGVRCDGFDGNPATRELTGGVCESRDLTDETLAPDLAARRYRWAISLEASKQNRENEI